MRNKEKGIISIFLALILIPTYLVSISSLDISRLYASKNYIKLANESALTSILLNYDKKLFDKYKLLASGDINTVRDISDSVVKNTLIKEDGGDNFHVFNGINTELNSKKDSSLSNSEELERQIIDYMHYKGPLELFNGFINMLDTVKNAKKYNNILSKKITYDEKLSEFDYKLKDLSKDLKTYHDRSESINERYSNFLKDYKNLKKEISKYEKIKNKINSKKNKTDDDKEDIKKNTRKEKATKKEFLDKYEDFIDEISKQIELNKKLGDDISEVNRKNTEIDRSLRDWKNSIEKTPSEDLKRQFKSEYTFSNKSLSKENVNAVINQIARDLRSLEKIKDNLFSDQGQISNIKESYSKFLNSTKTLEQLKVSKISNLERFSLYKKIVSAEKKVKVDKEKTKKAKSLRKTIEKFNDTNATETIDKDDIFDYISKENYNSIINFQKEDDQIKDVKNLDIKDLNSLFSTVELDFEQNSSSFLDNFLIAQYITDKFSDRTIDLAGKIISQKEYILFGKENLEGNMKKVRNIIFAIRLALNSMYGFTSPDVRKEALVMATAIAGWTGIGVPLVESLIITAMSFGETILDTKKLVNGKNLSIFKNKSNWTFSLEGIKNEAIDKSLENLQDGITNIMDSVEQIAMEANDKSFETLNQFINQTTDGVVQSLTGSLIIPIQNTIVDLINDPLKDKEIQVEEAFATIRTNLTNSNNSKINMFADKLASYLENAYKIKILDLLNARGDIDNDSILQLIEDMNNSLNSKVEEFSEDLSMGLRNEISDAISSKSEEYQIEIKKAIDNYLDDFGLKKDDKLAQYSQSGLSFKYSDYIKLFLFIKLNSSQRYDILKRMALIIDIEMKNISESFNILERYTSFKINTSAKIPMTIEVFATEDKKRMIENEMEISFNRQN